jgi:hypothetical protein
MMQIRRRGLVTTALSLGVVCVLAATSPAKADPAADIRSVIQSQITAFQADDFVTAFGYAADGIRQMFENPDRFGQMVRDGYPMVYRPSSLRWLELRAAKGRQMQHVLVTDAAGRAHLLRYEMISTAQGWKIAGVYLLPAPDLGA